MKRLMTMLALASFTAFAQTYNPIPTNAEVVIPPTVSGGLSQIWQAVQKSDVMHASNYLIAPYGTYAPKAPQKFGGGLFALYNVNNYVGLGIGLDWLGSFSLVSANASIKTETHPFRGLLGSTSTNSFFYNFTATPFALAGAGVDINGGGSSHTIWDFGMQTRFGHMWGGRFGAGAAYGAWQGSTAYDVKRYHFFLNWQKGF